jgi:diguanylate cyclase (GGDEF)-like protein
MPKSGLPNRRSLVHDLEQCVATREEPRVLMLFDLDGFKAYDDGFGHPAGDALLARLGRKLGGAIKAEGSAYRMGGDEFCVLAAAGADGVERIEEIAKIALSEHGEGFSITASIGSVLLPIEADEPSEALGKADQRMYARKSSGRASAARQSTDVLTGEKLGLPIVGAASALTEAAKLVRWSHERFDGSGYPDGLTGTDIPLGARIIAVTDAFDAMVSGRPYRPQVTIEVALAELRRCSGTQFDADVVAAFEAVVAERRAVAVGA